MYSFIHASEQERFAREVAYFTEGLKRRLRSEGHTEEEVEQAVQRMARGIVETVWDSSGDSYLPVNAPYSWEVWRYESSLSPAQITEIDGLFEQYCQSLIEQTCTHNGCSRVDAEFGVLGSAYPDVATRFWNHFKSRYMRRAA